MAIDSNLIPFGLRELDKKLMDVAAVPRGKACGCICPSCKTPLIARQGEQKEWHFAHASRGVSSKTEKDCDFSFYVSVRMMARQQFGEDLTVELPECIGEVTASHYGQLLSESFTVTEKRTVTLSDLKVEQSFMGTPVDVVAKIQGIPFVIYFTHEGRDVPIEFNDLHGKFGVLSISLSGIRDLFTQARAWGTSYQTSLAEFLSSDLASKSWVYHPRYKYCEREARNRLMEKKKNVRKLPFQQKRSDYVVRKTNIRDPFENLPTEQQPKKLAGLECVMCHVRWEGLHPGSVCPKCKDHMFCRFIKYLD